MKRLVAFMLMVGLLTGTSWGTPNKIHVYHLAVDPAALYQTYNELFFNNELPRNTQVFEGESPDGEEDYGFANHSIGTHKYEIYVDPAVSTTLQLEEGTMLHEMCHVRVWEDRENSGISVKMTEKESHAEEFQNCMKDLAKKDAFRDIW